MDEASKMRQLEARLENGGLNRDETVSEMISLALSIEDHEDRDLVLEKITIALAKMGECNKAQEIARYIEGPYEKTEGLNEIASQLISQAHFERALIILEEAEL